MHVLYVAPRYHTNQVPIMRGWIREGHKVLFISQVTGTGEDHRDVAPIVLGFSGIFNFFFGISNKIKGRTDPDEMFGVYSKKGFPPLFRLHRIIKDFKPDVAILRERSLYNIVVCQMCKSMHVPCILYNQSPAWEPKRGRKSLLWKIVRKLSPQYRYTVSTGEQGPGMVMDPHTYYVPFVMDSHARAGEKMYSKDGIIHFLMVGRYMECKHYDVVLPAFLSLVKRGFPVHLTTIGQVGSETDEAFYQGVVSYVKENDLESYVTIMRDVNRDTVFEEYDKADVFLLPSSERTSVAQLEAMSCALPVICSNLAGKSAYVHDGENGFLVEPGNYEQLESRMLQMATEPDIVNKMGAKSLEMVEELFSFKQYYKSILQILDDMKAGR